MSRAKTDISKIAEIIRLSLGSKMSSNQIARVLGISRGVVQETLRRARLAELSWPLSCGTHPYDLEAMFKQTNIIQSSSLTLPDWEEIYRGKRRDGSSLLSLWQSWQDKQEQKLSYSQFCKRYRQWLSGVDRVMRHEQVGGDHLFIAHADANLSLTNGTKRNGRKIYIFASMFGASNYVYMEAMQDRDWQTCLKALTNAFLHFNGTPRFLAPVGVRDGGCHADPRMLLMYRRQTDFCCRYGTVVVPHSSLNRKSLIAGGMGLSVAVRWVQGHLRKKEYKSLAEINDAINQLLQILNNRSFKRPTGCRRTWFESIDLPALRALPSEELETPNGHLKPEESAVERNGHIA